ncbi:MAG: hypothetical protein ACRC63_00685 [Metamycoplasmataceae bacterium]
MKNIDWNNWSWRTLQAFIVLLLNGCGIAIVVMSFLDDSGISDTLKELKKLLDEGKLNKEAYDLIRASLSNVNVESLFEALNYKIRYGMIVGEGIGIVATWAFVKAIYHFKRDKENTEQILNRDRQNTNEIVSAITTLKGKEREEKDAIKIERDINKYL